ncbi:MAG: hypothetical protein A2669_01915 [Candidatus Yanofskybacteria bacterium RIFCSPHIGHO2_01_FULL_48_25b]|uniref:DUF4268 domain-containing protein n=1 Tax=Candidatus Yanofskybacteria bacterium RIFCSPHIGHO2_01_FULL_48_25b TaxID=1802672 RepID=A0A1F8F2V4_9BACT|nr:MAG: hypothetical protein A2669_01915 [Candidatus Yanofskybacteria bacterium RIFCSPHIGHO2_01_FULL_48_25b]
MNTIGKLKKVPLREIWKDEAKDFTTWLSENIDALNEAMETSFTVVEREKRVGDFYLDVVAEDTEGNIVIIENQLERTDHNHLGQIITYFTNLNAKTAIWITSNPRDEHIKAINWLNESTPDDVAFYIVKVEAIRIGDSAAAPLFSVVAEPTEIVKEIGKEKKEYAERHHLRKEFWTQLLDRARLKTSLHSNITPPIYSWIGTGAGKAGVGYNYAVTNEYGAAEIYLDRGKEYPMLNKERFDELYKHKAEIEKTFGEPLSWERLDKRRASRIAYRINSMGLRDKEKWPELQDKMIDAMIRLEKATKQYIKNLK